MNESATQELNRLTERLAALIDVSVEVSSARDLDALLKATLEKLSGLLEAEAATLFMYDPAAHELWGRVMKGDTVKDLRLPEGKGIVGHVFATGRTLLLGDAYSDPRFNPDVDRKSGFRTRSVIAAPLRHASGKKLGVLQVLDRRPDAFTAEDRELVEGVAAQVAAVLDNVRLVSELEQRIRDLDALFEVEQAIAGLGGPQEELVGRVLDLSIERLGATAGSVLLVEEERGDSLFFRHARGEKRDALVSLRLRGGQGIAGHVAETGELVRVARADDSEFHDRALARRLGAPVGAVLCVPIRIGSRTLGALELLNKPEGFSAEDEKLAVLLAGQAGRALQRRQSQEEVERKARLATIGQMLGGVLHDLRTPLTVIGGYAEMLASEEDVAMRAQMAQQIMAQLQHISSMQQETLAFVRGERAVFLTKVYLHVFVKELTEQLEQEFVGTQIEFKVHAGYTGVAKFDESKIRRVMFNFARNAIDAMPGGGRFLLSIDREAADLVFRARDNGPGIPPEIASRLFESFVTSGKKNGTGLGLAIVKKIAKEHGGQVTFKSQLGKGTTFELRIPVGVAGD